MKISAKVLAFLALTTIVMGGTAAPARAFDGREGDKVIIAAGETVNDDLYVGGGEIVIDGTVNGDVIAFGGAITVNGAINGDLIAAGQTIVVNGAVSDDARIAGSVLFLGEKAKIGSDLIGAGYSLEARQGSVVGQDVVFAGGQVLLAGKVARNLQTAAGGLELRGAVGGDVKAEVGETEGGAPMSFPVQSTVPVPLVKPGLTVDPSARIGGSLEYTQNKELTFPSGIVEGKITRITPPEAPAKSAKRAPLQQIGEWGLGMLRGMVTLILVGLLLGWLFPNFMKTTNELLQNKPWPSLGWGAVTYAVFFFAILIVILVMATGGIVFSALTLTGLSGAVIWLGILVIFAGVLGFVLAASYLTKALVGSVIGKWILRRVKPNLAEHKFWPMAIGIIVLVFVIGLFKFPLIPLGFFGWLLNFAVILFGLGALWLWGRERFGKRESVP